MVHSDRNLGSYFFGLLGPHMMAIMKARIAAAIIYETIDLVRTSETLILTPKLILKGPSYGYTCCLS